MAILFRMFRTLYEKRGRKRKKIIFIFAFFRLRLSFLPFSGATFGFGLSFLVKGGGMDIIIPRRAFSSVGRALPSQGRGRRFESGKVHQIDSMPRLVGAFSLLKSSMKNGVRCSLIVQSPFDFQAENVDKVQKILDKCPISLFGATMGNERRQIWNLSKSLCLNGCRQS